MTAPIQLQSYLCDQWQVGRNAEELFNPSTEEMIATTCTTGLNFDAAFDYARTVGGTALRNTTFAERGEPPTKRSSMKNVSTYLKFLDCNATRGDPN